jgi:hypothetical protein
MNEGLTRRYIVRNEGWYEFWLLPYRQGVQFGLYKRGSEEWAYSAEIRWSNDVHADLELRIVNESLVLTSQFSILWEKLADRIVSGTIGLDACIALLEEEGFAPVWPPQP